MPKKPVYVKTRYGVRREWQDLTELKKAGTEELRAWLYNYDRKGDFENMSRKDMIYLIILELAGTSEQIYPGPKKLWPEWFRQDWESGDFYKR